MDRWQFDDYADERLKRYKGLLALAWIPFVSADRRGEFEAKARDDGLSGFLIRERDGTGDLVEVAPRDFYLPIYYAVPFDLDRECPPNRLDPWNRTEINRRSRRRPSGW